MSKIQPLIFAGRREPESAKIENNWTEIDTSKYQLSKQKSTILIFGGNNTENPVFANGYAKGVKTFLNPEVKKNAEIISFYYKHEPFISRNNDISDEFKEDLCRVYCSMLRPLLFDQYGKGNIKKQEGLESTFQKLVFVAHCGGANFINHILDLFYDDISKFYDENTTAQIIGKMRLLSYAPNELPSYNINTLAVMPTNDSEQAWAKVINLAKVIKIDNDFPKGFIAESNKAKYEYTPGIVLNKKFEEVRACLVKNKKQIYLISNKINPNENIGDHSIECLFKEHILNSPADSSITAKMDLEIVKLFMNAYTGSSSFDRKALFAKASEIIENTPTKQKD